MFTNRRYPEFTTKDGHETFDGVFKVTSVTSPEGVPRASRTARLLGKEALRATVGAARETISRVTNKAVKAGVHAVRTVFRPNPADRNAYEPRHGASSAVPGYNSNNGMPPSEDLNARTLVPSLEDLRSTADALTGTSRSGGYTETYAGYTSAVEQMGGDPPLPQHSHTTAGAAASYQGTV